MVRDRYTRLANDLQNGNLPEWSDLPVPDIAQRYWRLKPDAKFVDLIVSRLFSLKLAPETLIFWLIHQLAIRADEANHRDVNHTFAEMSMDATNPYVIKHMEAKKLPLTKADATNAPVV
jgi:ubiquinol oxidase